MTYKYFLDRLISTDPPFPWSQYWRIALADPVRPFDSPYHLQTGAASRTLPTLSAELAKVECLNDLVDIFNAFLKRQKVSTTNYVMLKMTQRGKGKGFKANEADRLAMAAQTRDVEIEVPYDEPTVASMVANALEYWMAKRPSHRGPLYGIHDCKLVFERVPDACS